MSIFDFNDIEDFDNHIAMSIPHYNFLASQVEMYAKHYFQRNRPVLDIGCSTGRLVNSLNQQGYDAIGVDNSNLIPEGENFVKQNIMQYSFERKHSVITSMFFLQFLSPVDREVILKIIKASLVRGGVFIVCEKTHFDDSRLENINTIDYMRSKTSKFPANEILNKSSDLIETMHLKTSSELRSELMQIGTPHCFFKSYGFEAHIVMKKEV